LKFKLGLTSLLLAYLLWLPGVTQPLLSLTGSIDKARVMTLGKELIADSPGIMPMIGSMAISLLDKIEVSGEIQAYEKTRSILGTVHELFESGNITVGLLVALFSILIPVTKGGLLLLTAFELRPAFHRMSQRTIDLISKWSMADVFVVAVIVAYMAANATRNMDEIFVLDARFGVGFYCFLAYCLFSILATQLMKRA
jgi:hypothetical protein